MFENLTFAFDAQDPESLKKRQKVAEAMMKGGMNQPQNVGEGIASLGDALLYRQMQKKNAFPTAPGGGRAASPTRGGGLW